jgi:hypothetical protein
MDDSIESYEIPRLEIADILVYGRYVCNWRYQTTVGEKVRVETNYIITGLNKERRHH